MEGEASLGKVVDTAGGVCAGSIAGDSSSAIAGEGEEVYVEAITGEESNGVFVMISVVCDDLGGRGGGCAFSTSGTRCGDGRGGRRGGRGGGTGVPGALEVEL